MKLIIVESPHKCATISNFLGSDYKVVASVGHIRDLVSGRTYNDLGVDINNNFQPTYVIPPDKEKVVEMLKENVQNADEVYLATDPDREGEAISWHLAEVLNLPIDTTKRLEFHEITKKAILKALNKPRTIDMDLVESQEARRIIDRIMGFRLSTLLQRKIKSQSAGRVQSVVLRYVVDKEAEVKAFTPEEYWKIIGSFNTYKKDTFTAELTSIAKNTKLNIKSEDEAINIIKSLPSSFRVSNLKKSIVSKQPKPPFITSSLQQEAYSVYKFSTKKTAAIAQMLYEGIEINGQPIGLITYIRTDSIRLSDDFIKSAYDYIEQSFGKNYLGKARSQKEDSNVQDAHEAIRPTDLSLTPKSIESYLTEDQLKLYTLIYKRALASLMANEEDEVSSLTLNSGDYNFSASQTDVKFDGFSKLYKESEDEDEKDDNQEPIKRYPTYLAEGDIVKLVSTNKTQHFTKGPSRYSEGKLVKLMQEKGIGRPSTYAQTISNLLDREYVTKEKNSLVPSSQGELTVSKLVEYFPKYMDATYTATMEQDLDKIAEGNMKKLDLLSEFYTEFKTFYADAQEKMDKLQPQVVDGRTCPICGKNLVFRTGKYGNFIGCSDYPKCTYVEKIKSEPDIVEGKMCPECGSQLVKRTGKKGDFIGCSNYPSCSYMEDFDGRRITYRSTNETQVIPIPTDAEKCPKCHVGFLVEKINGKTGEKFIACSNYPKCHYIKKIKKEKIKK